MPFYIYISYIYILFFWKYRAENLEIRRTEVAERLQTMVGCSLDDALNEVDASIDRLFYWGAYADKFGGNVQVIIFPFSQSSFFQILTTFAFKKFLFFLATSSFFLILPLIVNPYYFVLGS